MENECEALPGVAYPGVRNNRSTLNTKTGYDDHDYFQLNVNLLKLLSSETQTHDGRPHEKVCHTVQPFDAELILIL